MRKLFEIDKDIEDLISESIDQETGELVIDERLDLLQMEREQKIENVTLYLKELTATSEALDKEIVNLTERQKKTDRQIESLKAWLTSALNGQRFSTPRCEATFRKSVSVEVSDDFIYWATINGKYDLINHKETDTPNKAKIKELLKSGGNLADKAQLVEKQNIIVR